MKITIPKSYDHITIRQFSELSRLKSLDSDIIDYMIEMITIVTGESYHTIAALPLEGIKKIYNELSWIDQGVQANKIIQRYSQDGVMYVACTDVSRITANQYISIKEAVKSGTESNIHHIMAALYLPFKKKYNEVPADEVADRFYNHMPISVAWPLAVFFCNLSNDSILAIQDYLSKEVQEKMRIAIKEVATLVQSKTTTSIGDGSLIST